MFSNRFCVHLGHKPMETDVFSKIEHPLVGCLMFEHTTLQVPAIPELKIMIYTPLPETDMLEKLLQLMDQGVALNAV